MSSGLSFLGFLASSPTYHSSISFVRCAFNNEEVVRSRGVSDACDLINDKWGEFVITPAVMMGMDRLILDRIAFGGVKALEQVYAEKLLFTNTVVNQHR